MKPACTNELDHECENSSLLPSPSLPAPAHGGGIQNTPTAPLETTKPLFPRRRHVEGEKGGRRRALVADLNISIIYYQPVSGSVSGRRGSFKEVEKHAVAAFGRRDCLLEVRWIFSPDVHESIKPSLVDPQSSHCHISAPAKAFRNKSSQSGGTRR